MLTWDQLAQHARQACALGLARWLRWCAVAETPARRIDTTDYVWAEIDPTGPINPHIDILHSVSGHPAIIVWRRALPPWLSPHETDQDVLLAACERIKAEESGRGSAPP